MKTEFGIIENFNKRKAYVQYEPEKYNCIVIDDGLYINDWWDRLLEMDTYWNSVNRPRKGLARWGITLIPPKLLPVFFDIVSSDKRIEADDNLTALSEKIKDAIVRKKFMIHFGI